MKLTKIAVVGAGLIGRRHIESTQKTHNVAVAAVVDLTEKGKEIAQSHDIPFFNDIEEMIDAVQPDGVIIATPNELHMQNAIPCVQRGIPVLIEKPFATDILKARELLDMAQKNATPILTGYYRRFTGIVQATKEQISSGRIGNIVSAHTHFWIYKNKRYFDHQWRRSPGAGPVNINLSHDIDLLLFFMGDIECLNAYASSSTRHFEVEDTAVIIARFKNSALCTINLSDTIPSPWSWELTAGDNPTYPKTDQLYGMIGGDKGSIELPNNRLWYYSGERHWYTAINTETFMKRGKAPLVAQIEHFGEVIRAEADPIVTGYDGLKTMVAIEAIKMSAKSGKTVYLKDIPQ